MNKEDSMKDENFNQEVINRVNSYHKDSKLKDSVKKAAFEMTRAKYTYNFNYLGRPIFQNPADMQVIQEIMYEYKPDLVIETGIARGGSLIYYASLMVLLEYCGKIKNGEVIGIDIDIREHNKKEILKHPLNKKIVMLEGSSIDDNIIKEVKKLAEYKKRVLVILDSNHTHDHVLGELRAYAPLVSKNGYCIVCDTAIENLDLNWSDRLWGKGNSPMSALFEYLKEDDSFKIDNFYELKSLITAATNGFLKKIK